MPMKDSDRDRVSDPFNLGQPHPDDPFRLSQRDHFAAKVTGVHRHFSPVNGEVYEFHRNEEGQWQSHLPGDEDGSTFVAGPHGSLHDALRLVHRADVSSEGAAAGQREWDEEWRGHYDHMSRIMGGHMETEHVWVDYANRRMRGVDHGNEGPIQQGPN